MMKQILGLFFGFFFLSNAVFAQEVLDCPRALPTNSPGFCASFRTAAVCYCTSSGLPAGMCQNMKALYERMILVFGSLQRACEHQKYTTTQDCIDNWQCYKLGGSDSQGRLCSSTRNACE